VKVKVKCTFEDPEGEWRLSCILSLTSDLNGGGCTTPRPGRFTTGKEHRYPFYRRLGGPQNRSGWERKVSLQPGFDPRIINSVSNCYNDSTITAHGRCQVIVKTSKHEVQLNCTNNEANALKKSFHYFVIKSKRLRLNREIRVVCYKKPKKHTNTMCEYNLEVLNDTAMVHVITTVV